jgi:hypothetical protein
MSQKSELQLASRCHFKHTAFTVTRSLLSMRLRLESTTREEMPNHRADAMNAYCEALLLGSARGWT